MSKELITENQRKVIWGIIFEVSEELGIDKFAFFNGIAKKNKKIFDADNAYRNKDKKEFPDAKLLSSEGAQKLIDKLKEEYGDKDKTYPEKTYAKPYQSTPKVKEKERAHMVQHDPHMQYEGQTKHTEGKTTSAVSGAGTIGKPPATSVNTHPIDMMAFLKDVSSGKTTWSAIYYALPGVLEAVDRLYDAYKHRFTKGQFYTIFDVAMSYAKYGVSLSFVINSSHFIKDTLCFRATFYQGLLSSTKLFTNLKHTFEGESKTLKCIVSGVSVETKEPVEAEFAWQTADDSGYTKTTDKNGREYAKPLWKIQPKLMLRYRAYTFFIREHASVLLNGMYTKEELIDIENTK